MNRLRLSMSTLVAALAAILLVTAWVSVAAVLRFKRQDALEAETRQNTNLARAFTEQTLRVLAGIDQATLRTRDAVVAGETPVDLVRFANETGLAPGILVQLSLIDAQGRLVGSNLDPDGSKSRHVDLSTREHVRVHLVPERSAAAGAALGAGGLFIGKPVIGKVSGRWTIQISRRIAGGDGRTLGVVVASLDPSYFDGVYGRVALGRSGAVALVGADLAVRARVVGGASAGTGTSLGAGSAFAAQLGRDDGSYLTVSALDRMERLVAFHRVGDYPVYVTVATATDEALAGWRATRDVMVALAATLSAVLLAATAAIVVGLRRLERTNDALRDSEAQAQAASHAKTQFLAAISHELRTPLTSIRGFAELLEFRLEEPRFREKATLIRKGAERLNDLLSEILDMTRLEAGALELEPAAVPVRALVAGAAELFAVAAAHKGLRLESDVADDVPLEIECDALRLRQILHNLLSNAVKFTAQGQVRLHVDRSGHEVRFHVIDTGQGIAPELREVIFETFRQGSGRVSYEHGGTGLGLALARALALRMNGRLVLERGTGGGSHFMLALPAVAADRPVENEAPDRAAV